MTVHNEKWGLGQPFAGKLNEGFYDFSIQNKTKDLEVLKVTDQNG